MAKMRDQARTTPAQNSSGGEEQEKREREETEVSTSTQNRIERALMHLGFLEAEVKALLDEKTTVAGAMRQTAAKGRQQFDGPVKDWPPIKHLTAVLTAARLVAEADGGTS